VASAQSIVEGEVRELVRRRQLDPVLEPEATRRLVDEVLLDYLDRAAMSALPPLGDAEAAARSVFDQVAGFGPLQPYFDDRAVGDLDGVSKPTCGCHLRLGRLPSGYRVLLPNARRLLGELS
jgi:pilus assembly protein CpaF